MRTNHGDLEEMPLYGPGRQWPRSNLAPVTMAATVTNLDPLYGVLGFIY